jgi:protein N-terminal amidase
MEVVSVQFCPVYKDPAESRLKVDRILSGLDQCDILVLPEMAFPGYSFTDKNDISPFLE